MFKGLSDKEVIESRNKYGTNEIVKSKKNGFIKLVLESLNDPIIKILLIALGIKLLFLFNDSDVYEMMGIILAIVIASVISSISEYGSEKAFEKLAKENDKINTRVIRNNKKCEISIDEVVVGDIVCLSSGDKVPADGEIISGCVYADESMLSGEAKEKYKTVGSKVFRGSVITLEEGVMKVFAVGKETFYGSIADAIQDVSPESPLRNRLKKLAQWISKIGYIFAFLIILSYLFNVVVIQNDFDLIRIKNMVTSLDIMMPHLLYSLTLAVTVIVVSVPEGLPMMITLVLSSNMKRMLKNNVLVRKLVGIETAGSLNILFSDKTGTITKGELEIIGFIDGFGKTYKKFDDIKNNNFKELVYISSVYNNASTYEDKNVVIGGNITDKSNLKWIKSGNKSKYNIISKKTFNSADKYSSVTLSNNITYFKGAYEVFKSNIKFVYNSEGNKVLYNKSIENTINEYTKNGIRVLCFVTGNSSKLENLCLLGFALIKDEIRSEAIEGLNLVKNAGIKVVMITGDSYETALSISKEIGLVENESDIILTSDEMKKMTDEELKRVIPKLKVVARSLPEDKRRLVLLSQELGLVTGMTGDGINDAPALKKADVGFAMGSGTEVAKEVSDIVILDNNFLSIAKAVLFGRTIFKSIRKFIIFQLTVNFCTLSISTIGPFLGIGAPMTVIQMLWINMIMDTLAGIAFSYEYPSKEYMNEPPKKRDEQIINKYMINSVLVTGSFLSILYLWFLKSPFTHGLFRIGENDKYLMTAFFGLFIFSTVFNAFNARTHRLNIFANILKNKVFLMVIILISIIEVILIYFGGYIFRTTGLTLVEFEIMIFLSILVIPFDMMRKTILKRRGKCTGV